MVTHEWFCLWASKWLAGSVRGYWYILRLQSTRIFFSFAVFRAMKQLKRININRQIIIKKTSTVSIFLLYRQHGRRTRHEEDLCILHVHSVFAFKIWTREYGCKMNAIKACTHNLSIRPSENYTVTYTTMFH